MKIKSLIVSLLFATPLHAVPVSWDVNYQNNNFIRGELRSSFTVTGSFIFDADTGVYSSIDLTTVGFGTDLIGTSYTFVGPRPNRPESQVFFDTDPGSADLSNARHLSYLGPALTNSGGVFSNLDDFTFGFSATRCNEPNCIFTTSSGIPVRTSNSTLVGTPVLSEVPLPASGLLLLAGLGGMAIWRRRNAT